MNWNFFFKRAGDLYFTEFFVELTCLIVITLYFLKKIKSRPYFYLVIVAIASLLQVVSIEYENLSPGKSMFGKHVSQNSQYLYLIIESTCCLLFIKEHISPVHIRKTFSIINASFVIYTLIYWAYKPATINYFLQIPVIEGFLIIGACLYFFYELIAGTPLSKPFPAPPIWAISGMLILCGIATPASLLLNYSIDKSSALLDRLYIINNVAYCFLFITFAIAISCRGKQIDQSINSLP